MLGKGFNWLMGTLGEDANEARAVVKRVANTGINFERFFSAEVAKDLRAIERFAKKVDAKI